MIDRQLLYGLIVDADFDLHQDRPAPAGVDPDVRIRTGAEVDVSHARPTGRTLLHAEFDEPLYTFVEQTDGSTLLRFYGSCEFLVSPDLSDVVVSPVRGRVPGLEVVLTTGALLAYQLYRRSRLVLHASAVDLGGRAIAFTGHPGMGKSTMAALLCAEGGRLITDDVLAVEVVDECARARLGATELRLRKGADQLADRFSGVLPGRRRSADDRQLLRLANTAIDRLPLSAVVIPRPDREIGQVVVQRLYGKDALFALLSFPRLFGWQDPTVMARQFEMMSTLVPIVPVIIAHVPWGPPFRSDLGSEVLSAIDELTCVAVPG